MGGSRRKRLWAWPRPINVFVPPGSGVARRGWACEFTKSGMLNPLMGRLKPQSNGPLYRNTVIGTLAVVMGGLLHLVQRGGAWAGCGHTQSLPRCTKCNSPPINGQCTNFINYSGCRLTDLELTTRHSRFGTNTAVVPAPIENFFISTILHLLAL